MSRAWGSFWVDPRRAGWLMSAYFLLSLVTGRSSTLRSAYAPLAAGPGLSARSSRRSSHGGCPRKGASRGYSSSSAPCSRAPPRCPWWCSASRLRRSACSRRAGRSSRAAQPGGVPAHQAGRRGRPDRRACRATAATARCPVARSSPGGRRGLGLTGAAVAEAAITGRVASYNSRTVHLRPAAGPRHAHPGALLRFVGCADYVGCPPLSPRQLTVRGAGDIAVANVSFSGPPDTRSEAGQPFEPALVFTVPARNRS